MNRLIISLSILVLSSLFSCNSNKGNKTNFKQESSLEVKKKAVNPKFELVWETDSIFKTTESCLYDSKRDIIYVSSVNNAPRTKDNNGFISTINKNGELIKLDWATGLSAPKGMGIFEDKLYVTDIDAVVEIDINTGVTLNRYQLDDALMLNDITIDNSGTVYFTAMDTNIIYTLKNGQIEYWLTNGLTKPNGLLIEEDRLIVASLGLGTLKAYDLKTKESIQLADNLGKGDGVVKLNSGKYVVSDWRGEIFYINEGTGVSLYNTIDKNLQTADIGIIQDDNIILIPTFFGDGVKAYRVVE